MYAIRSYYDWNIIDLSGFDGVLLRVLGDGKVYRLRIRTEETGGDIAYNGAFETTPDQWIQVYVSFANMVPTYRGSVMDVGPLVLAHLALRWVTNNPVTSGYESYNFV